MNDYTKGLITGFCIGLLAGVFLLAGVLLAVTMCRLLAHGGF